MPDINGIPYVDSGDLVAGYPAVSQSLAQEVSDQLALKLAAADQTIIQVVRATDGTNRTTTSTSPVDANLSVTITPNKLDSAILLLTIVRAEVTRVGTGVIAGRSTVLITDNSNNPISGAEESRIGTDQITGNSPTVFGMHTVAGWSTPATTSATTYKVRWYVSGAQSGTLANASHTAQLFAIEVSA